MRLRHLVEVIGLLPQPLEPAWQPRLKMPRGIRRRLNGIAAVRSGRSGSALISTVLGETDFLVVYAAPDSTPQAVMVENKVDAPFRRLQPERCGTCGEADIRDSVWHEFATVLVALR